jgi:hypothetical protein
MVESAGTVSGIWSRRCQASKAPGLMIPVKFVDVSLVIIVFAIGHIMTILPLSTFTHLLPFDHFHMWKANWLYMQKVILDRLIDR